MVHKQAMHPKIHPLVLGNMNVFVLTPPLSTSIYLQSSSGALQAQLLRAL